MATLLATGPAVVAGWAGRLGVFAVGRDGALYHRGQTHPSDGWSGWVRLGEPGVPLRAWPPVAGPVNLIDLFGLAVFATDVDQLLYRRVQQLPDGPWSAWEPVGGPFTGPPATIVGAGGVNYLFAVEYDQGTRTGVLVEQSDRSGGAWSPHPGADLAGSPFVAGRG